MAPIASTNTTALPSLYPASERRGNNLKFQRNFYLKDKARFWPGLSDMCHVRSTTAHELQPKSQEDMRAQVASMGYDTFLSQEGSARTVVRTLT